MPAAPLLIIRFLIWVCHEQQCIIALLVALGMFQTRLTLFVCGFVTPHTNNVNQILAWPKHAVPGKEDVWPVRSGHVCLWTQKITAHSRNSNGAASAPSGAGALWP